MRFFEKPDDADSVSVADVIYVGSEEDAVKLAAIASTSNQTLWRDGGQFDPVARFRTGWSFFGLSNEGWMYGSHKSAFEYANWPSPQFKN